MSHWLQRGCMHDSLLVTTTATQELPPSQAPTACTSWSSTALDRDSPSWMQVDAGRGSSMQPVEGKGERKGPGNTTRQTEKRASHNSRAKNPSSSSLRVAAGKGAPGPSWVGSLTEPESAKGFNDWKRPRRDVGDDVLTGASASRRDQPIEFNDSRNEVDAILLDRVGLGRLGELG